MAMEYFPYGDLGRYITAGFTEHNAKNIISQLLEGLEIVHTYNFVYSDLKPRVGLYAML